MENTIKTFTLEEVERLVKFTYEVGFCDGIDSTYSNDDRDYVDADDFWNKNVMDWISKEITYVI
jgi:hypothetical protein